MKLRWEAGRKEGRKEGRGINQQYSVNIQDLRVNW
jgi:hypothetical protein